MHFSTEQCEKYAPGYDKHTQSSTPIDAFRSRGNTIFCSCNKGYRFRRVSGSSDQKPKTAADKWIIVLLKWRPGKGAFRCAPSQWAPFDFRKNKTHRHVYARTYMDNLKLALVDETPCLIKTSSIERTRSYRWDSMPHQDFVYSSGSTNDRR